MYNFTELLFATLRRQVSFASTPSLHGDRTHRRASILRQFVPSRTIGEEPFWSLKLE